MPNEDNEILDLVDDDDIVVGTIRHGDAYTPDGLGGRYIRAVSCFIMNSQGELWVPRRLESKRIAPGGLDYSAGGHVGAGETYEQAIIRELSEELSLQLDASQLVLIGKENPIDTPPYFYFSQVYLYQTDIAPHYNPDDFSGYEWLTVSELQFRLRNGEKAKDSLLLSTDFVSTYVSQHQSDK